jgi:hypothetical protein
MTDFEFLEDVIKRCKAEVENHVGPWKPHTLTANEVARLNSFTSKWTLKRVHAQCGPLYVQHAAEEAIHAMACAMKVRLTR